MSVAEGRALATLSDLVSRAMLARRAGVQFEGERDLYRVLGYKAKLDFDDYRALYDRGDIAARIVDMPARATWKGRPWLTDSKEDRETKFIRDWTALAKRLRIWHHLGRADRLAGIGRYSVLLIGLRDGTDKLSEPAQKVGGPEDVLYLMPYSEKYAEIKEWDTDDQSPNFGRPLTYEIDLAANTEGFTLKGVANKVTVHHSRVVHIAEGLLDDNVYGTPRLQRVYNRLHDLQKLAGGSAEIFWLIAAPLLGVNIDKDLDIDPKDLEELDQQIQEVMHNLRRTIQTQGATVTMHGAKSVDPTGTYDMLKELIAGTADIPQRILFGSERGELASTQDKEEWHERVSARRDEYAEPTILSPLVDRLVELNAISPPDGDYEIQWPELGEPKLKERAESGFKLAQIARLLSPENPSLVIAPHEIREEVLDWSPVPTPAPAGAEIAANRLRGDSSGKVIAAADPDALIRRIERRLAPELQQAFREAVKKVQARIDMATLEAALAAGNVEGAVATSFITALSEELGAAFEEAIRSAMEGGGKAAASALGSQLGMTLAFDITNPVAVAWAREYAAKEVTLITQESERAIRQFITEAFEQGITPRETAQRIYGQIGLTKQQQAAVTKFRARLEAQGVTGVKLDRRVTNYVEAQIRRRSRLIARHEIRSASQAGQLELWRQAVEEGLIDLDVDQMFTLPDGSQVLGPPAHIDCRCSPALKRKDDGTWVKVWIVADDERLCEICEAIPHMPENQF